MIDIARLREEPDWFAKAWADQRAPAAVDALLELDAEVRRLKHESESVRAEANQASKAIAQIARDGGDIAAARDEAKSLGDRAKALDQDRKRLEDELTDRLLELPNPCFDDVPVGSDETANVVRDTWGTPPQLGRPEPHWEIAERLGIIDFERGSQLSGSGFVVYRGLGARLQRALIAYFLSALCDRHGYLEHQVPFLVRAEALTGTGNLPKFADQLYHVAAEDLYCIPTAEVPLTNLHAGEILEAPRLPLRYTAHTQCFRREAGAAGVGTRGITRMHQFDKVEMVALTTPEDSPAELLAMRGHAEGLLRDLGLHYRVLELCTGDIGFSAARCFDIEVWSPGTGSWLEVSSCSNCTDFQARRIPLRFRREEGAKPEHLHTLNGSALALPRCVIAVLETYLDADGGVMIPDVLRPHMGGVERIPPPGD